MRSGHREVVSPGADDGGQAQCGRMQGWPEGLDLGHLESGVLVTGAGDLVEGRTRVLGGQSPGLWPLNRPWVLPH